MSRATDARTELVLLKLDAAGRLDLDQPAWLGTAVDVRERIRTSCPTF